MINHFLFFKKILIDKIYSFLINNCYYFYNKGIIFEVLKEIKLF